MMLNKLALFSIKVYQRFPKSRNFGVCMFEPTCSEYAKECFQNFSFLKAWQLTINRLKRCNANYPKEIDYPPESELNL